MGAAGAVEQIRNHYALIWFGGSRSSNLTEPLGSHLSADFGTTGTFASRAVRHGGQKS